jgi:hypothetical protein
MTRKHARLGIRFEFERRRSGHVRHRCGFAPRRDEKIFARDGAGTLRPPGVGDSSYNDFSRVFAVFALKIPCRIRVLAPGGRTRKRTKNENEGACTLG